MTALHVLFSMSMGCDAHGVVRIPRANRLLILTEIVDEMDLAARVNHDLIAGSDAQARIVVGAKVHYTLARGRVRLFVESPRDRETTGNARLDARYRLDMRRVDIHCRRLRTGGHI